MDAPVGPKRNYSAEASRERLEPEFLQMTKHAERHLAAAQLAATVAAAKNSLGNA